METLTKLIHEISIRCPGGRMPDDYLVIDLETSGLRYKTPDEDGKIAVIVQFGYAKVHGRKIDDQGVLYIKRPPGTMQGEAEELTGITDEMLQQYGIEPSVAFPIIANIVNAVKENGQFFVGHNVMTFDSQFLKYDGERNGVDIDITPEECIDTGSIIKAARMGLTPSPTETLCEFLRRIRYIRSRTKWNLKVSAELLDLEALHKIDMNKAHDAGYDCMVTHYVLDELRKRTWLEHPADE